LPYQPGENALKQISFRWKIRKDGPGTLEKRKGLEVEGESTKNDLCIIQVQRRSGGRPRRGKNQRKQRPGEKKKCDEPGSPMKRRNGEKSLRSTTSLTGSGRKNPFLAHVKGGKKKKDRRAGFADRGKKKHNDRSKQGRDGPSQEKRNRPRLSETEGQCLAQTKGETFQREKEGFVRRGRRWIVIKRKGVTEVTNFGGKVGGGLSPKQGKRERRSS